MGSATAMYQGTKYCFCCSLHKCVACFVFWNLLDVNMMNILILQVYPTRGSPNNACLVANVWYNCSTRYDMRSELGISAREAFRQGAAIII